MALSQNGPFPCHALHSHKIDKYASHDVVDVAVAVLPNRHQTTQCLLPVPSHNRRHKFDCHLSAVRQLVIHRSEKDLRLVPKTRCQKVSYSQEIAKHVHV